MAKLATLMICALVTLAGSVNAQCSIPTSEIFLDQSIEVFRVGDFDPSDSHLHPNIFTVTLCSDTTKSVRLRLTVTSSASGILGDGETDVFQLPAGTTILTNQVLAQQGGIYELRDFRARPASEDLENSVNETGRLPEGEYCFEIELLDGESGVEIALPASDCLSVSNPLDLELLSPGAPFGEDPPAAGALHPRFLWTSRAQCWRLTIARAQPGDASGEDVMEHVPVHSVVLALPSADCSVGNSEIVAGGAGLLSWTYPSSAEDLEPGRTYCWQATALVETSGGPEEFVGPVFCFRLWTPGGQDAETVASLLELMIRQILERGGGEIEDLKPTGDVWLNGQVVDPIALKEIVDGIVAGRIQIEELRFE